MAKTNKISLEEQMKTLQKHFTAIVATVKDLKGTVNDLAKKVEARKKEEIDEILQTQKVIEEMIDCNAKAIKCMEEEFRKETKGKEVLEEAKDKEDKKKKDMKIQKICRYYNRGYCKFKVSADFLTSRKTVLNT